MPYWLCVYMYSVKSDGPKILRNKLTLSCRDDSVVGYVRLIQFAS